MAMAHTSGDFRQASPVVRRGWKLAIDSQGPLLTGLFGFPWREEVLQAKCTEPEFGSFDRLGNARVDRRHRSVPSLDCTCGIYASDEPHMDWLMRRLVRGTVMVTGFVRLSGRILVSGSVYRAEEAQVVGPLTIVPPPPGRFRNAGARWGAGQRPQRVWQDGDRFVFWYSRGRRGLPIGEWYRQIDEALATRYSVEVVGLLPAVPVLSNAAGAAEG
jgi:hypothetical protein